MDKYEQLLKAVEAAGFNLADIRAAFNAQNARGTSAAKAAAAAENGKKGGRPSLKEWKQVRLSVHSLNRIKSKFEGLRVHIPGPEAQRRDNPDGRVMISIRVHKDDLEKFEALRK